MACIHHPQLYPPHSNAVTDQSQTPADDGDSDDHPPAATDPTPNLTIDLQLSVDDSTPALSGWLESHVLAAAQRLGMDQGRISLAVVSDEAMARLHEQHRGESGSTDVLTFDLRDPSAQTEASIDADVVICLDEAAREAHARSHATRLEVLLYAVHGLLHLQGYDDHHPDDARAMHQKEDELLKAIGIGPIYDLDPEAPWPDDSVDTDRDRGD